MDIKTMVEIKITDMKDGKVIGFILDNVQYHASVTKVESVDWVANGLTLKGNHHRQNQNRHPNVVDRWLDGHPNIRSFTLVDFFKSNPRQGLQRSRIMGYVDRMCADRTLTQWHDGSYKVTCRMGVNGKKEKIN